jgi:hypothetical protein
MFNPAKIAATFDYFVNVPANELAFTEALTIAPVATAVAVTENFMV